MRNDSSAERPREKAWFNWPLVVGLLANFALWGLVAAWILLRRR